MTETMSSVGSNAPEQRHIDLVAAANAGDESRVRSILDEPGATWTTEADHDSLRTALQRVCARGRLNLVNLLLTRGATIDAKKSNEVSALFRAVENGQSAIARLLIDRGANLEATDRYSRTSIFAAAVKGHADILHMLLAGGANVKAIDSGDRTALLHVSAERSTASWSQRQEDVVNALLRSGVNVEAFDASKRTALMWAASTNRPALARCLLAGKVAIKADVVVSHGEYLDYC